MNLTNPMSAAVSGALLSRPVPPAPSAWIDEVAREVYRISIALPPALVPGGFSLNQYLLTGDEPLLFHTGPRKLFPLVRAQIEKLMPLSALRWIGLSHLEADECGALPELLTAAPLARPVCGRVAAQWSLNDLADVVPRALADGECLQAGNRRLRWTDAPHLPHGWDCGYLFDEGTRTLLCGDLFTQPGCGERPLVADDILAASEARRTEVDDFSHSPLALAHLERLAALRPETLACMHGSAWAGDGAALLRRLGQTLARSVPPAANLPSLQHRS
jgi:flavorubredoxin